MPSRDALMTRAGREPIDTSNPLLPGCSVVPRHGKPAMNIMISYRRADSGPITGRIYDRLRAHFGADHVFLDIDSIPMGTDYRSHIHSTIGKCDVLLPVIGPRWVGEGKIGERRIDDPADLVRLEVAHALERNIRVIPLLVQDANLPATDELPDDLKSLRFRNALKVDSSIDFHHHIDRLCTAIEAAVRQSRSEAIAPDHAASAPPTAPTTLPQPVSVAQPAPSPAAQAVARLGNQVKSAFAAITPGLSRFRQSKWFVPTLGAVGLIIIVGLVLHFIPSKPASAPAVSQDQTFKKITRVPDARSFAVGSAERQLVGTWRQGNSTFDFFEDHTFAIEDPANGGDEGRWELKGVHLTAKGTYSHPARKWTFILSTDKATLSGVMTDDLGNSMPVTLKRVK